MIHYFVKLLNYLEKKPTKSVILNVIIGVFVFAVLIPLTLKAIDIRLLKLWVVFLIISLAVGMAIEVVKQLKGDDWRTKP